MNRSKLIVTITTLAPVLISRNNAQGSHVPSEEYIPGTVLLGAFANRYLHQEKIRQDAEKNENFFNFFLSQKITFSPAYISTGGQTASPSPLAFQCEKTNSEKLYNVLSSETAGDSASDPRKVTKPLGGFVILDEKGRTFKTVRVHKTLSFHHERDDRTGTSKKGIIFNYEAIAPYQTFTASIFGDTDTLNKFSAYFGTGESIFFLGRSKNAEYGKVSISIHSPEQSGDAAALNTGAEREVELTLRSPGIFLNEFGFASVDMKDIYSAIETKLGLDHGKLLLGNCMFRTTVNESYVSVWKGRYWSQAAILPGAAFRITVPASADISLLEGGIGERTHEGFGQIGVRIATDIASVYSKVQIKENTPEGTGTTLSKDIAEAVINSYIIKAITMNALEEAHKASNAASFRNITSSQISKITGFCKAAKDTKAFAEMINKLRKTSADKLEGFHIGKKSLLDILKETVDEEKLFGKNLRKLFADNPEFTRRKPEGAAISKLWVKTYLPAFLTGLRKMLKFKGGSN